jgi:hypothetical protein
MANTESASAPQAGKANSAQREKLFLLCIAGLAVFSLALIALVALNNSDKVNSESATLIGVIVTGLAAFAKDAIQAVRAFWQDDRLGKMTDQIAASSPVDNTLGTKPTGSPDDPVSVTEAPLDSAKGPKS